MAESTTGRHLLAEKDFVEVVDAEGNDLPAVPKHWGADQLPAGAEKKTRTRSTSSRSTSSSSTTTGGTGAAGTGSNPPAPPSDAEPAGNASTEAWTEYAVQVKGAKPEDLVDEQGEPLGRDELRTKFGTPAGS